MISNQHVTRNFSVLSIFLAPVSLYVAGRWAWMAAQWAGAYRPSLRGDRNVLDLDVEVGTGGL